MPVRHRYSVFPSALTQNWPTIVDLPLAAIALLPKEAAVVVVSMYSWNTTSYYMYADHIYNEFYDNEIYNATQAGRYAYHNNAIVTKKWIHFGPEPTTDINKTIRVAGSKGYIYMQTEWYYTYDEVEIFPEVLTQAGRDTLRINASYRPTVGGVGWNATWRDVSLSELTGGHGASAANPVSGLLVRNNSATTSISDTWDHIRIAPDHDMYRAASATGLYWPYASGDMIVPVRDDLGHQMSAYCNSSTTTSHYTELYGFLKVPMRWIGNPDIQRSGPKTWTAHTGSNIFHRLADDEVAGLVLMYESCSGEWEPRDTGYSPDGRQHPQADGYLVPTGVNNELEAAQNTTMLRGRVWLAGAQVRRHTENVVEMFIEELDIEDPALYYTPDNFGSIAISYSLDNAAGLFSSASTLKFYLSGGASNSDPDASLGGARSTTELASAENSLFDDAGTLEVYAGLITYRCLYLKNTSGQSAIGIRIWTAKGNLDNNFIYVGEDPAGISGTAQTISTEADTPTIVGAMVPLSEGGGYIVPVLAAGEEIPLWFGRQFVAYSDEVLTPDTVSLHISVLDM